MSTSASTRPPRRRVAGERARDRAATPPEPPAEGPPAAADAGEDTSARRPRRRRAPGGRTPSELSAPRRPRGGAESAPGRRRPLAAVVALVVSGALLAAALVLVLRPHDASDADEVAAVGSASTTLESLLGYSYQQFDQHVAQVEPQLAQPFLGQFRGTASATLKTLATTNQTVVQAKVYDVGVMDATPDSVRVLAFVNQATTTKAQPDPQIDQNRVIATMTRSGDRWLLSDLQAF